MIVKRITVKRFRGLKEERTLDFSPGLNIVKGSDNEAGKSSLRIAITKALFQDPTTTRKEVQALTSWGADEPWEIALEFEANEGSYRITKSFKDQTCQLESTGSNGFVARNKNTISEKIAELTGCPSEVFFESTACIGQEERIRIIPPDASNAEKHDAFGTITRRLQAKLSGTEGVDVPTLLNKLYIKTHHKEARGPYFHIKNVTERIAMLRSQKLEQGHKIDDILEKRAVLTRAREELEQISPDLSAKLGLREKNRRVLELQKEIARDKTQYDTLQRAKEIKTKVDGLETELEPLSAFVDAEEKMKHIDATNNRVDSLSRQSAAFQEELRALEQQKPSLWPLAAGIVLIAGGLIGLTANQFLWIISIAGFLLSSYWLLARRAYEKQMKSAIQKMEQSESELADSREEELRLLKEFGCTDYAEYQQRLTQYRRKAEAKRDASRQLEALAAGKDWQTFVREHTDLDIQVGAKLKELEQLQPFRLEPLSLQKLEQEVTSLLTRKAELERETGALEKFFQYTDADKDQLADIEEELAGLEQQREFWERKRKVYELTRELLEQAHKQTLFIAADLLQATIGRYMSLITDGRYDRVKINESDLSIWAFSGDKNDWVDVTELSRATQDQFYICTRLALVGLVTAGKRPPILLDDPFVNYHAKRLKKMMVVLQEIAKENQIMLFTCSDAYDYLGHAVSVD